MNLEHLAADGNTDDVAANPANASILARRAVGAARAARQDAPEFLIRDFLDCVRYARVAECVDCDSHGGLSEVFALVAEHETRHADAHGRNRLYYLALPHELYLSVARAVHLSGRSDRPPGWTRVASKNRSAAIFRARGRCTRRFACTGLNAICTASTDTSARR